MTRKSVFYGWCKRKCLTDGREHYVQDLEKLRVKGLTWQSDGENLLSDRRWM